MQTGGSSIPIANSRVWRYVIALAAAVIAAAAILWTQLGRTLPPSFPAAANLPPEEDGPPVIDTGRVSQLSVQQQRGKQIYLTCTSPAGDEMTALLGNSGTEVPAAVLTCVNCHRHDGRGKPEGGIFPSNVRWDELTRPYGVNLPHGQSRPPYDESLVKRCITMGLNPAGKRLDDAMPRYRMTHRDLADLIAYLKVIGDELDPGLSADTIRIGVILPPQVPFGDLHGAIRAATRAYVEEFNRQGGVYQREIELCFSEAPRRIEDRAEAALDFVQREQIFALANSFIAGAEDQITRRLHEQGVPLVGATTMYPRLGFPLNPYVFYLGSGLAGQCRALARFAADQAGGEPPTASIVFPAENRLTLVARALQEQCESLGFAVQMHQIVAETWHPEAWTHELTETKPDVVFSLLSAGQNLRWFSAAEACHWFPLCFVPGSLVGPPVFSAPAGFDRRIFLSFTLLPSQQPGGMQSHHVLAKRHALPSVQLAAQFEALAGIQVLAHGLEKAGAELSRERLVEQLEGLYEYRSGFTAPITYGPNRRVGAIGAYIVTIDLTNKKLAAVSDWVDGSAASHP